MSESLFEAAHYFVKIFRASNEYQRFQTLCNELNSDPQVKQILNQMNKLNYQLQQKQMMGQEIRQQEVETLKNMEAVAQQHVRIKQFLEADYHINMLLMELNKIISKPLEDLYDQLVGK
ncbi:YlbF family regulator [Bacillus sp. T3]|uniref:YlbF family regulator n=1 Tax=Bacillus sp. T3 TaxID=467262 RepID=UPI0029818E0B|nr:YlbF family regulator [Bacillus sp. T3]